MASNFHLLAQMKVTKAKGLNTIWPARFGWKTRLSRCLSDLSQRASNTKSKCIALFPQALCSSSYLAHHRPNLLAEA
jgi:hypothetical protein